MTPFYEPGVYGAAVAPPIAFAINHDVAYNMIQLKVAYPGDTSIITGIDIGNSREQALHHEWRKLGSW